MWLNSNWLYRKAITITGQSGAGTGYQVLLKIGASASATGDDFHLEGNSADFPSAFDDGGDLRFTDNDGTTELDFWVQKVEGTGASAVAHVWVKVTDDLGSNVDIYCYYGNSSTPANGSDGAGTWDFYDDFDDASLDGTKWTDNGNVTESGGQVSVQGDSSNGNGIYGNVGMLGAARLLASWEYAMNTNYDGCYIGLGTQTTERNVNGSDYCSINVDRTYSNKERPSCKTSGSTTTGTGVAKDENDEGDVHILWDGTAGTVDFMFTDGSTEQVSSDVPGSGITLYASLSAKTTGDYSKAGYYAVGKYQSTEPAFSTAGSEEEEATDVTVTPSALVATFSTPSPTPQAGVTETPSTQVASFSVQSPSVNLGITITPDAQVGTFSLPAVNVLTPDVLVTPNAVVATFAVESPNVNTDWVEAIAQALVATFSLPSASVITETVVSPDAQVATFSLPTPDVLFDQVVTPSVQELTFSMPTVTVIGQTLVQAGVVVATFEVQAPTVIFSTDITPDPVVATFVVNDPAVRASYYQTKYTVQGDSYGVKYT